ncbi:hypothetical protein [Mycobacteroides chelonae]|uniref:hypothetical protein n=1 Tax=Mycobacteroides chelonae TaxID=1774 RepID=UPI0018B04C6D|nr:hypothetical protein [Mycobacteroides chelonae]MBF9325924.1 hypothetical protein [Mycobacteroides chelonae]MBF9420100.1 hypothetical protein [Mycobacteroides chelonae]
MTPTRKQIDAAKPEATIEMARHWIWTAAQMETAADDYVGYLTKPGGHSWDGQIAEATQQRGGDDRRAIINMADDITKAAGDTINAIAESVMPALKNVRQLIENCEKLGGFTVHDDLTVTYEPPAGTSEERAQQCRDACARFSEQIKDAANQWWAADQHAGELIDRLAAALPANFNPLAGGGELAGGLTQALGIIGTPKNLTPQENREIAFRNVFGRAPVSPSDWATASMLDPHNYEPKNAGANSEIRVAKIEPRPGEGVVRTNFFIPGAEAAYPSPTKGQGHNLGDNRGFNPNASPEQSRVSVSVDYENGLVIARQNPSIDAETGQAKVGVPWVSATQSPNGGVFVSYNTADPWAPIIGETGSKLLSYSVHGDLAIQPSSAGLAAGGTVTMFPAVEIYHDSPSGSTSTVFQNMPANTTSYGPAVGLVGVQPIGDQGLRSTFDTTSLTPLGAASSAPVVITPSVPPARGEGLPPLPPYPVK